MKTKIMFMAVAAMMALGFASCNLDYFPSDELTGDALLSDEKGAQYIIDGCYAMLKEEYVYVETYSSSNYYARHYFQMAEFPADNTCLSGRTTDPLYQATCYKMTDNLKNNSLLWWIGYKVILSANTVIEHYKEGENAECDQLIGEAYFLRALMHFNLVTLFAKPYSHGRDNLGVVIRTSTTTDETHRAKVGEVYDQVVADLWKATGLMGKSRGNAGYASKNAALGLLSRVYLYEEKNDSVLYVVDQMGDPVANLDPDFENYFPKALSSKETLFAIAHTALETRAKGSIGSMYYDEVDANGKGKGVGWGEVYASAPLLNLFDRYPEDKRLSYIKPQYTTATGNLVYFPIPSKDDFRNTMSAAVKTDTQGKYCMLDTKEIEKIVEKDGRQDTTYKKARYDIHEVKVNGMNEEDASGEYKTYYVEYEGEKCYARIDKSLSQRNTYPMYFVTKFSYQDGDPMLSSPVMLRWAEVLLNRAEAYAKLGQDDKALADVDAIRNRAGIPADGMFSTGNRHGYTNVLDIVLDERRLELCFEGHRMFDVYRNKRDMDRRFPGVQPWEVVKYDDNKIQYPIPYGEHSVSGIQQNPGY